MTGSYQVHANKSCRLRSATEHFEFCSELHRELWRHCI